MATGRGRLSQLHWSGLQASGLRLGAVGWAPGRARFGKGPGVTHAAGSTTMRPYARRKNHCEKRSATCSVSLDCMPSEILLKIFSYLDAVTLLCAGCVSRRFYHLASDNFIWIRLYSTAFSPKRSNWKVNSVEKTAMSMNLLSVEDKEAGYWKKEYITKQIASVKAALTQVLKPVNPYTGFPVKTKMILRKSDLGWVIILKEKSGKEYVMEHVDFSINDSSVTIVWYGKNWPLLATLSTLDLCGVTPVFMAWSKTPTKNGPRWHSLIANYDLSNLTESTMVGCDRLVRIFCLNPGLLVGLWKREEELAFVMANLHIHHLVERSTLGSATIPYELPPHSPILDDSPEYGLYGYQLHVDMHSSGISYLCGTFHDLFTKKGYIENGYVKLTAINFKNNAKHLPLIGKVGFYWRTDVLDGFIKTCSIMDITLLDEYRKPFWCFSSPVCVRSSPRPSDGPDFLGQTYYVDYVDSEGKVHVELLWIEETEEYFIVSLVLYLSVAKINHWFGTEY
ncbi:PREDICTED: F-box only protein 15 [Ceratotherium simum simum]|uniref:F-box only protein 15 n=1 Tax=Ceratotherium simum simum TaxID=73337 RepID=A0ABM0H9Z7_CERSS|nr:PREDICTED: F-box only protein 15 [Ceratotherium simum simum]